MKQWNAKISAYRPIPELGLKAGQDITVHGIFAENALVAHKIARDIFAGCYVILVSEAVLVDDRSKHVYPITEGGDSE